MEEETVALDEVRCATDQELIARLRRLVRSDQVLNARLLVHLGEVDARRLYRERAYASMFSYCVAELRMSEDQAYSRIQAARLSRQFPRVLQLLVQGTVHLTAIKLLGPHLTLDNHVQLLERASGRSKREIELLVAEIAPKRDVPSRVRKLPAPSALRGTRPAAQFAPTSSGEAGKAPVALEAAVSSSPIDARLALSALSQACDPMRAQCCLVSSRATSTGNVSHMPVDHARDPNRVASFEIDTAIAPRDASDAPIDRACHPNRAPRRDPTATPLDANEALFDGTCGAQRAPFALEAPRRRGSSKPLSPGRYKMEFTAGQALHDKLAQLRDLLRHQVPDGDLAVIVERAVDLLLYETKKQRFGRTRTPKKPRPATASRRQPRNVNANANANVNSRYVPRAVVREVHQRDAGQCTFVSSDGKRCAERGFLELHHHDQPYARGGKATLENLRLVCRAHNALFAERDYGREFMRSKQMQAHEPLDKLGPERAQV